MKEPHDHNPKTQKSEKILSWLLSGLGVALLAVGAVGYFIQDPSHPSPAKVESPIARPPAEAIPSPVNPKSPILLITVDRMTGELLNEAKKNPSLAPNFLKLVHTSTYFSNATAPSLSNLSSVASVLSGTFPSAHQYFWEPWNQLSNGKKISEADATTFPESVQNIARLLPHYYTAAQFTSWWAARNTSIREGWKKSFSKYRVDVAADLVIPNAEPAVKDLLSQTSNAGQPLQFFWINFDGLDHPFDVKVENLRGLAAKDSLPTAAQLRSFKYMNDIQYSKNPKQRALVKSLYLGAIRQWDEHLGLLIKGLKTQDVFNKMTIILAGSSGYGLSNEDRRFQVPLLIKSRDQKSGSVNATPVSTVSIAPTIRELAGYQRAFQFQAPSLIPALDGNAEKSPLIISETLVPESRNLDIRDGIARISCDEVLDPQTLKTSKSYCFWIDNKGNEGRRVSWQDMSPAQKTKMVQMKDQALAILGTAGDPFALVRRAK